MQYLATHRRYRLATKAAALLSAHSPTQSHLPVSPLTFGLFWPRTDNFERFERFEGLVSCVPGKQSFSVKAFSRGGRSHSAACCYTSAEDHACRILPASEGMGGMVAQCKQVALGIDHGSHSETSCTPASVKVCCAHHRAGQTKAWAPAGHGTHRSGPAAFARCAHVWVSGC